MSPDFCIFCLATPAEVARGLPLTFYWREGTGETHAADRCTAAGAHEFPAVEQPKAAPPKKRDAKLCVRCGLHPRNPAASSNGCEHVFEARFVAWIARTSWPT